MPTTALAITGMSCQNCVRHATNALLALEGVEAAEVSLEAGSASVHHSEEVNLEQMVAALEEEGYSASLVSVE
jgi:copper chaperone CopZ